MGEGSEGSTLAAASTAAVTAKSDQKTLVRHRSAETRTGSPAAGFLYISLNSVFHKNHIFVYSVIMRCARRLPKMHHRRG